jgi:putative peptide zinc metalloprotease protein
LALLLGLMLVLRQWDTFAVTLVDTFTLPGMAAYAVALTSVKIVHELAHAFTAKRFGCRVPTMGLAFLVLWPVLYTDVNETWLLAERRQRLLVGAAGILSELAVAAWATLAWAFLPEGALKQAAFVLAAITWLSSLAVNLAPFMRFDGYFLLMDVLEVPNLHPRAFTMGRWWLRETLFGLGERPPEPMPPSTRRALIAFAVVTWAYRLALFLGIAVLVYHFFIKAIGVLLFAVEIWWFVLLPIWREIEEWKERRAAIAAAARTRWTISAAVLLLLVTVVPWQSRIDAPAVLKAAQTAPLHLPFPARLEAIHVARGERVEAGQPLLTFVSPDLDHRTAQAMARLAGRRAELDSAQLDPAVRDRAGVLREAVAKAEAELASLAAEADRLVVVAPFAGAFLDPPPDLQPGQVLIPEERLGLLRGEQVQAIAYVAEEDLHRLALNGEATFTPSSLDFPSRAGRVERIDPAPVKALADAMLASLNGGEIPSRLSERTIVPERAVTRVAIALDGPLPDQELPGAVSITGGRRSLLGRLARSVVVVLVREWGA